MGGFGARVSALLRTNIALALLCVISVAVVYQAFKKEAETPEGSTLAPVVAASAIATKDGSAHPAVVALKDMPAPDTYRQFTYAEGMALPVSGTCADLYRVTLIFPLSVDYRSDPLSAKYNTAEACEKGSRYADTLDLAALHLTAGGRYYVIQADEGAIGLWHDPR